MKEPKHATLNRPKPPRNHGRPLREDDPWPQRWVNTLKQAASPPVYMAMIGIVLVVLLAAMSGKRVPEEKTYYGRMMDTWDSTLRFLHVC